MSLGILASSYVAPAGGGGGPYVLEGSWNNSNATASTSITVTPSGQTAGNLLVAGLSVDKSATSVSVNTSDGWAIIDDYVNTSVSGAIAWKIADGDASDAVTFTTGASRALAAGILEFSGFGSGTAVDDFAVFPDPPNDTVRSGLATWDPLGAATNAGVSILVIATDSAPITSVADYTVEINVQVGGNNNALGIAYLAVDATDATATGNINHGSDQSCYFMAHFGDA